MLDSALCVNSPLPPPGGFMLIAGNIRAARCFKFSNWAYNYEKIAKSRPILYSLISVNTSITSASFFPEL